MNSVSAITDKITAEAKAWSEEHLAAARQQAQEIAKSYADEAAGAAAQALAQAEQAAESAGERAVSQADMEERKMLLAARQRCIAQAFEQAVAKLCSLPDEDKILLMVRCAVKYQSADAEYIFNAGDRQGIGPVVVATVNALLAKQQIKETFSGPFLEQLGKLMSGGARKFRAKLSDTAGSFAGGFILKQGNVESNCTFEVLCAGVREELEGDVSSVLFQ